MKLALISDLHCTIGSNSRLFKNLENLKQMKLDGLFIAGDLSMHGYKFQLNPIYRWIEEYENPVYFCLGNHDIKRQNLQKYQDFLKIQKPYYTQWLHDIPVIILNSEQQHLNEAILSDEQCDYLENELNKYQNQLVFVMVHQPLNCDIHHSKNYHIGQQQEKLQKILNQHQQIIFLSGHLHNSYNTQNIDSNQHLQINIPSFQTPSYGRKVKGLGYIMEIESNYFRLTPYNFIKSKAYENYAKVYYFNQHFIELPAENSFSFQHIFSKQFLQI